LGFCSVRLLSHLAWSEPIQTTTTTRDTKADGLNSITHGNSPTGMATSTGSTGIAGDGTMGVITAPKAARTITAHLATIEPTISSSDRADAKSFA